ncbi:GNAT family protein [Bacillus spongiae]|uniref:GNAT family protein n=1 Tax=Bacillus spongiae TaxID=2683610 RepID=A0ABU8HJS8_9BACI
MEYKFTKMTQQEAEEIAYEWHYEGEYSFYDMEADQEDLAEFLDPVARGDSLFAVTSETGLIGFFSVNKTDTTTVDIGLGMHPNLTGKGNGLEFINSGLEFVQSTLAPKTITLSVATFNQRAIKVYQKVGFVEEKTFLQETNGSTFEFLKMTYYCEA